MRRQTWVVLGATTSTVALVVGGWLWASSHTADGVHVSWRDGDPTCTGTTVKSDPELGAVVQAVRSMRCTYRVEIRNESDRTVHLDQVEAPFVGPRTGAVVTADGAAPERETGGRDAVFVIDEDLESGHSTGLDIVVVFHPQGCNDGGTMWVESWPTLTFDSLSRSFDRSPSETFAFHREGKTPGCRRF